MNSQHRNSLVFCRYSPFHAFHENEVVNLPLIEVVLVACLQPSEVLACTLTAAISSQLQEDALVTAAAHRMDVFSDLVVSCPSGKTS